VGEHRANQNAGRVRPVDEYRLAGYPLVLSTGKKLFSDRFASPDFTLTESRAVRSGGLVNTYRGAGSG
jgi:hypothetical protein